jgi:DNA gyrase inhibitor GyrI
MKPEELTQAVEKFRAYLDANGLRTIAIIVNVCDDHTNTNPIAKGGLNDVLEETCLRVMCDIRGLQVSP